MSSLIVPSSLHTLVHKAESLLSNAEESCATLLRDPHNSDNTCTALVQLNQALLDARDDVQREYDHISNAHGNAVASVGDQNARLQFWLVCNRIEEKITNPLGRLAQQFLVHQSEHRHEHGHGHGHMHHHHCHFCRYYYHHHHHHHHHSSLQWSGIGVVVAKGSHNGGGHHPSSHHYLGEYEPKFLGMIADWNDIKGAVASCFDELEGRLKKEDTKKDDPPAKKSPEAGGNNGKSVADAAHKMIQATSLVDEEMRLIANVGDKIFAMGGILPRASRKHEMSYVSSRSSSSLSCRSLS